MNRWKYGKIRLISVVIYILFFYIFRSKMFSAALLVNPINTDLFGYYNKLSLS